MPVLQEPTLRQLWHEALTGERTPAGFLAFLTANFNAHAASLYGCNLVTYDVPGLRVQHYNNTSVTCACVLAGELDRFEAWCVEHLTPVCVEALYAALGAMRLDGTLLGYTPASISLIPKKP